MSAQTDKTDKTVATEILKQLGGGQFMAMTGTKKFGCTDNSISFKVGMRCKNKITHVEITLNSLDLYDVVFLRWYDYKVTTISKFENVYDNMLQKIFTSETGLNTRLF